MGTTLPQSQKSPAASGRKGRPNHSEEFRRRLAAAACEPGVSVSKLAREHGINANMLFTWRRRYQAQQQQEATVLLPVTIEQPLPLAISSPVNSLVATSVPVAPSGVIEIRVGRAVIRIDGVVDASTLRTVLGSLTP